MGVYSRDYLREDNGHFAGGRRSAADPFKILIGVNVAVFVLQHAIAPLTGWLDLDPQRVIERFEIWRLLTFDFCHQPLNIWHLIFNMWFLYLAGRKLEDFYGPREFLFFYLASGVASGVFSVGMSYLLRDWTPAVGASGSVAALMILYALHWPKDVWYLMGVIPVQAMWLAVISVVFDVWPFLNQISGRSAGDGIAHAVHLGGMLFAGVYWLGQWRIAGWFHWLRKPDLKRLFRPRTKLRIVRPDDVRPEDLSSQVDHLLQKVQDHGEASLTEAERAILVEAGRRYRERR